MIQENIDKLTFAINQICVQCHDKKVNDNALKAIRYIQEVINWDLPENKKVPFCEKCNIGKWWCDCKEVNND